MAHKLLFAIGAAAVVGGIVAVDSSMGSGVWPIENGASRATPLHFNMYVTPDPAHNPINPPERFIGNHVGLDFEITPEEATKDVAIYAVCTGTGTYAGFAIGYGGLIAQQCMLKNEKVTMLYGHLDLASLPKQGTLLKKGEKIAILGAAKSHDTDDNRKHLHFGIVKGWTTDYRGYTDAAGDTAGFIDPRSVLPL
jgi:murein DD-endopeptidase MepM/ murein hydrolase activator NlpD